MMIIITTEMRILKGKGITRQTARRKELKDYINLPVAEKTVDYPSPAPYLLRGKQMTLLPARTLLRVEERREEGPYSCLTAKGEEKESVASLPLLP